MKTLVLAEKPSVGRDIARVLNCTKNGNGFIEGNTHIVTWALGHLVTLADPEQYDGKYKSWQLDDLPMLPSPLKLEVIGKTSKQYQAVKAQIQRNDVSDIVIATDAGREGELVARWILLKTATKKPVKRLWISSVTDQAIREGFRSLKAGQSYMNLFHAAAARSEADWYVGLNATRALTCKFNAQLSCGRVQTPTLAMIGARDVEIRKFKSEPFYGITANVPGFELHYRNKKTNDGRFFSRPECENLLKQLQNKPMIIGDVVRTPKKTYAPRLYDLTELQRDGNRIFGFSAKETLSIMQNLYEQHKILTYPRTDSRYISTDIVPTLKSRLEACSVGPYAKHTRKILLSPIKGASHFVDNAKVSDHHAIIPTEEPVFLNTLSDKEHKIYDLVVKRFMSVLYPPFEYTQVQIKGDIEQQSFFATGKIVHSEGWKAIYGDLNADDPEHKDDQVLPDVKKGDQLKVLQLVMTQGRTMPPSPFTEATLLSAMENPLLHMKSNDQTLNKSLGDAGGIGTVATRADIIEKLLDSFVIEKRNNQLFITAKGNQLLELVPEELKSPLLTAKWELELSNIANGRANKDAFIEKMKAYTKQLVLEIRNSNETFKHSNVTGNRCPDCGKYMLEVAGKKGKMLVCQDRECGYRKSEALVTNARCPKCHKKLSLHGEGDAKLFICICGFKEKLTAFNERRKDQPGSISKNEVSNYLNQQQKNAAPVINSAFADILKKL